MIQILFDNPLVFVVLAGILVVSLSIHEFAHAYAAYKLGDSTAKYLGRLTLNPLAHLDPIGTLLILFVGFGWGKPVPVDSTNFRHRRRDTAIVSFAGPLSNFVMCVLFALAARFIGEGSLLYIILITAVYYNLMLGFFNLLPVHPLDGFKVVYGLLPFELAWKWKNLEQYGMLILLVLIMTRSTGILISPLIQFSLKLLGF